MCRLATDFLPTSQVTLEAGSMGNVLPQSETLETIALHFLSRNPLVTPQQAAEQKMMRVEYHAAQDPQVSNSLHPRFSALHNQHFRLPSTR